MSGKLISAINEEKGRWQMYITEKIPRKDSH